jgi:hypothetical protein
MKRMLALAAMTASSLGAAADARRDPPPLRNAALLNMGFVCRWQDPCIRKHQKAMVRALKYVKKYEPPAWKIQLCNRNASRNGTRVDWVGYDNCIRNPNLKPPPARKRRARR